MRKLRVIFLFICILLSPVVRAQQDALDSLRTIWNTSPVDTLRLQAAVELSSSLYRSQPDSAVYFGRQASELARRVENGEALSLSLKNIGLGYYFLGDYVNALDFWQQALDQYRTNGDRDGVSNLLSNIGAVYYNQGNDVKALEFYLESLKVAEELNDTSRIAYALSNIGAAYDLKSATSESALAYYRRALPLLQQIGDPIGYGITLGNLGGVYYEDLDQLDSAKNYYQAAEAVFEEQGETDPYTLYRLGEILAAQGDYAEAAKLQIKAYEEARQRDGKLEMAQALSSLGSTYIQSGQFPQALQRLKEAESLALEIGSYSAQVDIFSNLSEAYAQIGNYSQAFNYQKELARVRDTIYNAENDRRIEGLQFQFDLEKKESEIELLSTENELKEAEIQRASILRNFLFAIAIFLVITVGGVSYTYWLSRRSNKIISEERNRSESILLNILPVETAEELKQNGKVSAKRFDQVTVLFTDFRKFTEKAKGVPPEEVVKSVDYYFRAFDEIISRHNLEKIKTIGDAYMCAGGLPVKNDTHPEDAVRAGLEIIEFVKKVQAQPPEGMLTFDIRIGVHTGPVVAGVVGTKKFQYDIWGSTVNLASMMETNSEENRLNVSSATYELIKDKFHFEYRGEIIGKHGGKYKMYFVGEPELVSG